MISTIRRGDPTIRKTREKKGKKDRARLLFYYEKGAQRAIMAKTTGCEKGSGSVSCFTRRAESAKKKRGG